MSKVECYKKIIDAIEDNRKQINDDYYLDFLLSSLRSRVKINEIAELFDLKGLPENGDSGYIEFYNGNANIMYYRRDEKWISWSDDDRQPEDEYLYCLRFPTSGYIFGSVYDSETFNSFFCELKKYNPKYSDSRNRCLYFSPEFAKKIHEEYRSIFEKYRLIYKEKCKENRKKELMLELEKLEEEQNNA